VDLANVCLERIDRYNPSLNAFVTVTVDQALATAREMEAEQSRGKWRGPLHGIPVALKDNIDTAGIPTTAASELFKERTPTEDAEVVRRLRNAGAVVLGKLNLHEFAYGATSAVSYFGAVHNPWSLDRVPGGTLPPGGFRSSGVYLNVRGPEAYAYHAKFLAESPDKYQEATRRALQGFAETNAAVYAQVRRQVDLLRREITTVFSRVDLLVVPTMLGEPVTIAAEPEGCTNPCCDCLPVP
jgi:Asp-tRNA(Asn)/Glu-tRNA(Gln) amidotransferase A subunit family amidase